MTILPPEFVKGIALLHGDCLDTLKTIPDDYIQLIVTSPPYAKMRKRQYGGIDEENYVDWFLPRAREFKRVLKPTGTLSLIHI